MRSNSLSMVSKYKNVYHIADLMIATSMYMHRRLCCLFVWRLFVWSCSIMLSKSTLGSNGLTLLIFTLRCWELCLYVVNIHTWVLTIYVV